MSESQIVLGQIIQKNLENQTRNNTPIKAVYGLIEMEVNHYLVVVTKATVIGQIYHRKVFQVQKMEFICLGNGSTKEDSIYITGLEQLFRSRYFYFSDDYDLTNSLEEFFNSNCSMKNKKLEYMFNSDWVDEFLKIKAYEWITGFISGFVSISFNHGVNHTSQMCLISRRDKRRQGMRWLTRGCDLDGNTANTVQTQLIFLTQVNGKQYLFSHVQLRGSMPFIWKQNPNLQWNPKCQIHPHDKLNSDMILKNYQDIKKYYQNATMINLIDKKGTQKRLGDYFDKLHNQLNDPTMSLVWFDFHEECKNMKYQNLAHLVDMVSRQIQNYGYFHTEIQKSNNQQSRVSSKKNSQKGIFRTNCMDCLDRTNVVQSVIARQILLSWLIKLGFQHKPRNISAFQRLYQNLQQNFRLQWTKNADVLSILYSGTPAMKTDFTAVGKRTAQGALKDGYNGVKRYFLGNFYDSRKQDFINFSLNKLKPKKNRTDRIRHSFFNSIYLIIALIILIPVAVYHGVESVRDENTSAILWQFVGSFLAILIFCKTIQIMSPAILRSPIKSGIL